MASPEIKRTAYEKEEVRQILKNSSDDGHNRRSRRAGKSGFTEEEDGTAKNDSGITLASGSAPSTSTGTISSDGIQSSDVRSPLPSSFPQNYPYMSAASANAIRPKKLAQSSNQRSRVESEERHAFLAALSAPSIIANPSELLNEEELWISEIVEQVQAVKGVKSTATFYK